MFENMQDNAVTKTFKILHSYPDLVNLQTLDISIFQDLRLAIGNDLFFSDLVTIYLSSAENLIESIQIAFANQNVSEFNLAAHSLKSTSASIGATRLSAICRHLEKNSQTGKITISSDFLDLVSNEYEQVTAAIKVCIIKFMAE